MAADGNQRHLLKCRELAFPIGLSLTWRNLLQSGLRRQRTLEIFLIDIVKGSRFSEVIKIDGCEDHLVKVHVRFLKIVEKVAHRLARLVGGFRHVDSTVWPGD